MEPLAWLGITPAELDDRLAAGTWRRWVRLEPALAPYADVASLHALRGAVNDPPLHALARLAAVDGYDEHLAAVALAHQMERGARFLMHSLRDLSEDIDPVVMSALWVRIRTFPWQRRTRAIAANLIRDTRADVLQQLVPRRTSARVAALPVDPQTDILDYLTTAASVTSGTLAAADEEEPAVELQEVLRWALAARVITSEDAVLLLDLVRAGAMTALSESPWMRRGAASQTAVDHLATRYGVCGKTIRRRRDQIIATLRASSGRYYADAA